jgi:hypothetical protein
MMNLIVRQDIQRRIYVIRGKNVMIDYDLAEIYDVETKYLNRQVKRNISRFPQTFMFQLTADEKQELVTNWHQLRRKHSYTLPYAFTEHGVVMLAHLLKSEKAVAMSIVVVETFISLREIVQTHKELGLKLEELERKYQRHEVDIQRIFEAIKKLLQPPPEEPPKPRIGFK